MTIQADTQENNSEAGHKVTGKYLTFMLGRESYGIGVLQVREIIKIQTITPVPQVPQYVRGVINLRGKIIPVLDLRLKFGIEPREYDDSTCIIVVELKGKDSGGGVLTGVIVDGVEEVLNINEGDVEPSPKFGENIGSTEYILGMAKIKEEVKTLIDIDRLISIEQIAAMSISS